MGKVPASVRRAMAEWGREGGVKGGKNRAAKIGPDGLKAHSARMHAAKAAKKKARGEEPRALPDTTTTPEGGTEV